MKARWYTWAEKLPPFDVKVVFYSDLNGQMAVGTWSYPKCSNHEEVIANLKSGKWKHYGCCIGAASHWYSVAPIMPPPPTVDKGAGANNTQQANGAASLNV